MKEGEANHSAKQNQRARFREKMGKRWAKGVWVLLALPFRRQKRFRGEKGTYDDLIKNSHRAAQTYVRREQPLLW